MITRNQTEFSLWRHEVDRPSHHGIIRQKHKVMYLNRYGISIAKGHNGYNLLRMPSVIGFDSRRELNLYRCEG